MVSPRARSDSVRKEVIGRAQQLIGATSIFRAILSGFGFTSAQVISGVQHPGAGATALAAVSSLAVALILAFAALVLERGHIDVDDPTSLWKGFDDIITRRWRLVTYSSYMFVLAIVLTLVAAMLVIR
jgi:multisubunit Na+/H+ antiporter MnhB subunit